MFSSELLANLHRRPFQPFRIHLTDGTVYEVRHPELVMVGRNSAIVGIPTGAEQEPIYDRFETISLLHVVRLTFSENQSAAN